MRHSLIICSRNRSAALHEALDRLDWPSLHLFDFEVVLVDSASTDDTAAVMHAFARRAPSPVLVERAERPGLSHARNIGIRAATGVKLLFTDDDCYLAEDYLQTFVDAFGGREFQYGGGDIALFDPSDDLVGCTTRSHRVIIPRGSLLGAGVVQGANMFFLKYVFDRIGGFREDMGAGTPFPAEDIEMCTRASLAGFVGGVLPELKVLHHHRRKTGTPEIDRLLQSYDYGRGAYYASLLMRGVDDVWRMWQDKNNYPVSELDALMRRQREFRGAADFMAQALAEEQAKAAAEAVLPAGHAEARLAPADR